ncbi:MAG: RNA polymerase sigma factor [candidate division Zixibacteria bacterium]|nr:RNA polymerase sigma factor [candidate division Zixibacteria bacterium]
MTFWMNGKGISDNELLAGLRQRRPDAFRQLVEIQKHNIVNICNRFVHNPEDAEDIAQETFVEVYRSISSFRRTSSLQTWIYRIAVSRSLNFIRNQNRLKRRGAKESPEISDEVMQIPASASDGPLEVLEQKERQQILDQALDSLPPDQRVAFVLSKCNDMSYQEIAAVLETTVPSIESLVHRAKTNLQKKLHAYYRTRIQNSK